MTPRTQKQIASYLDGIEKHALDFAKSGLWTHIGVRFEKLDRKIGDVCGVSRDNLDREDERDFPDHGDEEYEELPELGGTSAWEIYNEGLCVVTPDYDGTEDDNADIEEAFEFGHIDCDTYLLADRIYLVGAREAWDDGLRDEGEVVLVGAEVLLIVK